MIKLPKLLVLCSSLPGSRHGGGVVQAEILKRYPRDRYVCFSVNPLEKRELPECLKGVHCRVAPLVPKPKIRGARFYLPLLRAIGFHLAAPMSVRQAVAFGRRHGVELVWAELQGDAVVIARRVADALEVPFVGTVWDDPESWLQDGGFDRFSRQLLQKRFRAALQGARRLSTAGEAMQEVYEKEYGIQSVILRHGFERSASPPKTLRDANGIVIGFVGNAYGPDAWEAFLAAVAQINASERLPGITVRAFGPGVPYRRAGVEIEDRGWQPAEVMLQEIAKTDFCYLPYWFEPRKRRHVELSFPNKFETYLAAGRPVLYHGPEYAGITQVINQYGVGICVHSLSPAEIADALKRLIINHPLRDSFSRAALAAFQSEFNATRMMENFARLIGVQPGVFV